MGGRSPNRANNCANSALNGPPHSKHTHDTGQCRKWNNDGTPKGDSRKQGLGKTKSVSMYQVDDEADIVKAYKKLKK